jgi:phosphoglycerol transferase MdoB-like AlkP superfamily enzyme
LLLVFFNFVLMRGGLQPEPVSQNSAYFSDYEFLNQSALNTEWNLFNNVVENLRRPHNPFIFMEPASAKLLVQEAYDTKPDSTVKVLTTDHPNVVIIQMESYTADVIESLGGDKGVAPNFEKFIKNGVLFNNIYSSADRTDKGIISIMSGFPAQAVRTIVADIAKQKKLPAIATTLKNAGYQNLLFLWWKKQLYALRPVYESHLVDHITDEAAFDKSLVKTEWGVFDDVLLVSKFNTCSSNSSLFSRTCKHPPITSHLYYLLKGISRKMTTPATRAINSGARPILPTRALTLILSRLKSTIGTKIPCLF